MEDAGSVPSDERPQVRCLQYSASASDDRPDPVNNLLRVDAWDLDLPRNQIIDTRAELAHLLRDHHLEVSRDRLGVT